MFVFPNQVYEHEFQIEVSVKIPFFKVHYILDLCGYLGEQRDLVGN